MYIFICKGTWIYSGQYNLYLSSTLIKKNSLFCCVAPGHWDSRTIKFCAMFSKSSLFKIEYSFNIETQCLKNIQLYSKPHFHIFTRKRVHYQCYQNPPGTVNSVQHTICSVQCVVYTVQFTVYSADFPSNVFVSTRPCYTSPCILQENLCSTFWQQESPAARSLGLLMSRPSKSPGRSCPTPSNRYEMN